MPDRNDTLNQYPTAIDANYSPDVYTTAIIDGVQAGTIENYATGDQLEAYADPGVGRSLIDSIPADTYSNYITSFTEYADYRPIGNSGLVSLGVLQVAGWSFIDTITGTTPFLVRLRDGADAGAQIIAYINLSNPTQWVLPGGIRTRYGLFVEFVTGTPTGVLYIRNLKAD